MPPKLNFPNADNLIKEYLAGVSVKQLAQRGIGSRTAIKTLLRDHGIPIRNRSDGMFARMARTSPKKRKALAAAANANVRGRKKSDAWRMNNAFARERSKSKVGRGEVELQSLFSAYGISTIQQLAVDGYNIDLVPVPFLPIAVELLISPSSPVKRAHDLTKIKRLTDAGWQVVYIWCHDGQLPTIAAAQNAVKLIKALQRHPPARGHYWVIRGSGQLAASSCDDFYQRALVPAP